MRQARIAQRWMWMLVLPTSESTQLRIGFHTKELLLVPAAEFWLGSVSNQNNRLVIFTGMGNTDCQHPRLTIWVEVQREGIVSWLSNKRGLGYRQIPDQRFFCKSR